MQFNRCSRCGCFFVSSGDVCPNCQQKDAYEINQLKNYLENSSMNSSIQEISLNTGITEKNLHRFFKDDNFIGSDNNPTIL